MDRVESEWIQRTKGKDVVGILKSAGMPCTGLKNYIPQFKEGYEPDIERVWDLLSGGVDGRTSEKKPAPSPKRGRGRPPGAKNKPK